MKIYLTLFFTVSFFSLFSEIAEWDLQNLKKEMSSIPSSSYYRAYTSKVKHKMSPCSCCLIEIKNNEIFINEKKMIPEEAFHEALYTCRYPWVAANMLHIVASEKKLPDVLFLYCFWDVNFNPEELKDVPILIGIIQKKPKNTISFQEGVPFVGYQLNHQYNEILREKHS